MSIARKSILLIFGISLAIGFVAMLITTESGSEDNGTLEMTVVTATLSPASTSLPMEFPGSTDPESSTNSTAGPSGVDDVEQAPAEAATTARSDGGADDLTESQPGGSQVDERDDSRVEVSEGPDHVAAGGGGSATAGAPPGDVTSSPDVVASGGTPSFACTAKRLDGTSSVIVSWPRADGAKQVYLNGMLLGVQIVTLSTGREEFLHDPPTDTQLDYEITISGRVVGSCGTIIAESSDPGFLAASPCGGPTDPIGPTVEPAELLFLDGSPLGLPGLDFGCGSGLGPDLMDQLRAIAIRPLEDHGNYVLAILPGDVLVDGVIAAPGLDTPDVELTTVTNIPVLDVTATVNRLIEDAPDVAADLFAGAGPDDLARLDPRIVAELDRLPLPGPWIGLPGLPSLDG